MDLHCSEQEDEQSSAWLDRTEAAFGRDPFCANTTQAY